MITKLWSSSLALLIALYGCGDDDMGVDGGATDGASARDTGGVVRDGGSDGAVDAGPPRDAGPRPDGGPRPDAGACMDSCPAHDGVTWECETRFMYGTNYAWSNFGGDFGGISAWGQPGVASARAQFSDEISQMKAAGVNVIRWWMFPRFWTEAITFDGEDTPSGIGGTLLADVEAALALAEENDVYVMLTPFSFDSFTPTTTESGIYTPGLQPIVTNAARRARLLENLVRPIARAVEESPNRRRMIAWDMINEPEWAIRGANMYGGEDFGPDSRLTPVTHAEMERFLADMAAVLRSESTALVSVGGAAIKWGTAWTHLGLDFYMLHYYDWVYEWFPYTTVTLESVGLADKPVVMGEFPNAGLSAVGGNPARTVAQLTQDLWDHGYGGALSWAFSDGSFPWTPATLRAFADAHPCESAF